MQRKPIVGVFSAALAFWICCSLSARRAAAQFVGVPSLGGLISGQIGGLIAVGGQQVGGQQVGGQQVGGQQVGGQVGGSPGGIMIDAQGVVTPVFSKTRSVKLQQKRLAALSKKVVGADVNSPSKLRKVSLVQLEKACEEFAHNNKNKNVPPEMWYLAGLQRIDYVFVYPKEGDIVIAGPAEGFAPDGLGHVVGVTTGRPPLRLDDLVVALRAMQGGGKIGCSIDPQPKNLKAMSEYVSRSVKPVRRGVAIAVARRRYATMAKILGMQKIRSWGVPAGSHFGRSLVEADYAMKRISMGLYNPRVRGVQSYLAMLGANGNSMQRWWFTPLYDAFVTTPDGDAFQFTGQRAQLLAQEELALASGRRKDAATTRLSTRNFAKQFTLKFPELAEKVPVFAELQNLIDLAVLAALLKRKKLPEKVGWKMPLFLDPRRGRVATGFAAKEVPSVFNFKSAGSRAIVGLVGGGVVLEPAKTVEDLEYRTVTRGELVEHRDAIGRKRSGPKTHPWWWD